MYTTTSSSSSSSIDKYGTGRTTTSTTSKYLHSSSSSYGGYAADLSPDRRSRAFNSAPRQIPSTVGRSGATASRLTDINGNIRSLSLSKSLSPSTYSSTALARGIADAGSKTSSAAAAAATAALLLGNDKRYDATKKRLDAFYSSRTPSTLLNKSYNYRAPGNLSYFEKYNKQQQQQQQSQQEPAAGNEPQPLQSRYVNMNRSRYGGSAGADNAVGAPPPPQDNRSSDAAAKKGVVGIRNIGNTCYMNSVLQCLSNTKSLTDTVLGDTDADGKLIRVYRDLLSRIWTANDSHPVDTTSFKSAFQRLSPRFAGYEQQDSQEFLRLLLDRLHMDVNRVKVKPRTPAPDPDETLKDNALAAHYWQRYLATDNSTVVDLFAGQLKSTLECSVCGHKSITFEVRTRVPCTT